MYQMNIQTGSRYRDWLNGRQVGVPSPGRVKNVLFSTSSRPVLGSIQPPIQWIREALSPEVKRPEREADHAPPASAEVKKMWIYTSTPTYAFMAWCLISLAQKELHLLPLLLYDTSCNYYYYYYYLLQLGVHPVAVVLCNVAVIYS
jgi:hypothetical protein